MKSTQIVLRNAAETITAFCLKCLVKRCSADDSHPALESFVLHMNVCSISVLMRTEYLKEVLKKESEFSCAFFTLFTKHS